MTATQQKELAKLEKIQRTPERKNYIPILIVLVALIYVVDEIASSLGSVMQSEIVNDFFVVGQGLSYNDGLARLSLLGMPFTFVVFILPFYKALADKYGRKLFLIFNTVGMGVGMLVCFLSQNVYVYLLGGFIIKFFTPNDMQVMYIVESVPAKHRAKIAFITKSIGMLGVSLISVLRLLTMGDDPLLWRNVFIVPVLVAIVVSLISFLFVKETPVYVTNRINYLTNGVKENIAKTEESIQEAKDNGQKAGVWEALKFIFKHKQIRFTVITAMVFIASASVTSYYSAIMTAGGMSTAGLTQALFAYPIFNALTTALCGFAADKLGRKGACTTLGVIATLVLTVFIFGSSAGLNPYLLGALYGVFSGCYWCISDILLLVIPSESTPTYMRSSVVGTLGIFLFIGGILSAVIVAIGLMFVSNVGLLCFAVFAPFMILSLVVLNFKVHETQGVAMDSITGDEYDD